MRFHFHRPLLEFARLLFLAVALIFIVGFVVEHTPPTVGFVIGVLVAALSFFGIGVLLIRGAIVRRKPRPVRQATQVQHEHPVLGTYTAYTCDGEPKGWSCTVISKVLGCEANLWGKGPEPSEDEIERWTQLEKRLLDIFATLPPPLDDDGWGRTPGTFTPSKPRSVQVILRHDSGFLVTPKLISSDDYMLSPTVHIDPDGETWCDGWSY